MDPNEVRFIYKAYKCHLCTKTEREFANGSNLKRHFTSDHVDQVFRLDGKGGNRKHEKGVVFITKADLKKHENYDTRYMCAGCEKYYSDIQNLSDHLNIMHTVSTKDNQGPLKVNLPEPVPEVTPEDQIRQFKRRKTTKAINQIIFNFTTPQESTVTNSMLNAFDIGSGVLNIKSNTSSATVCINASQNDLNTLAVYSDIPLTFSIEVAEKEEKEAELSISYPDDYLYHVLRTSRYPGLSTKKYEEINDSSLDVLNQDWTNRPYYRVASGQLLAGAILVDGKQVLLINCIELYNRKPSQDPHYERFGSRFMTSSTPTSQDKYKSKMKILSKTEDRSKKLIIGTLVFNGFITSSIRLDEKSSPEVGASTYSFVPSNNTKVYISSKSVAIARDTIENKIEVAQTHDLESQLKQIRSNFTNPNSYTYSRFSSPWTDFLSCRPFTVFTLKDNGSDISNDYMVSSSILSRIAAVMINNDGILNKKSLKNIPGDDNATPKKLLVQLITHFKEREELDIIADKNIEKFLNELARITTNQLKIANEKVIVTIEECMKQFQ